MGTYQEGEIGRDCVFLKGRKKHANGNNMVESRKLMHDKERNVESLFDTIKRSLRFMIVKVGKNKDLLQISPYSPTPL